MPRDLKFLCHLTAFFGFDWLYLVSDWFITVRWDLCLKNRTLGWVEYFEEKKIKFFIKTPSYLSARHL